MRKTLIATALATGIVGQVAAGEYTTFSQLEVRPLGAQSDATCAMTALLNLPATWHSGDAIVVMLTAAAVYDPTRDPLIAALLAEEAGVLEVSPATPATCADDDPETSRLAPPAPLVDLLFGSLLAARQQAGAGLVVAIGHGPGSEMALGAVEEAEAVARFGAGGPRFAAALVVANGRARLRPGAPQAAPEQAGFRLHLLCEALVRGGAIAAPSDGEACREDLPASLTPASARPAAMLR